MQAKQILLANRPKGLPQNSDFKTVTVTLPDLREGEVLIRPIVFSVDPYMRGRMSDRKSYIPPFEVGKPLEGGAVSEVLESKDSNFQTGDRVMVSGIRPYTPWSTASIFPGKDLRKVDNDITPSYYLGVLGMPGLTAYFGLMNIGKPKAGETVMVSGAAGAVGIVVGQIAKIKGCRVVGIAGGSEKIKMLTDTFNFDAAIDYKDNPDLSLAISTACPDGIDIYFDNVGGEISDAVFPHLNFFARVALCGQIALYNTTEIPVGPRVQPLMVTRSILMQGFIYSNYAAEFKEAMKQLTAWVRDGQIKYAETIEEGFDHLPQAFLGLFSGRNSGKMIVKV
ncbi:NADP-dependent oxidoreductase [Chitinophaga silvatica]|uniref:NADP-dependent oxidoreductase n=1 Tax=Chitinophaga silvatica TaxID=2282649 RepID=A0A3E1Y380_9BACT|nr:NADP-dependent oxidoreductase [Chitinophaga silvatica]RFS19086.1 NADP-dependent oxidoreductase [Chitinophaga silvatica]